MTAVDRRYGVNKYGDGKLYGASEGFDSLLFWGVEVDWDGDGLFDGSNEAPYMTKITVDRGRENYIRPEGDGWERISTGKVRITLLNWDGRYDGWNADSPLFPNVTRGKDVRIRVRDIASGIIYPVFFGLLDDVKPTNYQSKPAVVLEIVDGWSFLRNNVGRVAMQQNISPDEAVALILDAAKWPSRWGRSLDVTFDNIKYFWSTAGNKAGFELEGVANSFMGLFFVDAQGRARYVDRSNTSSSVEDYPQEYLLKDIGNPQPSEIYRNVSRFKVHPRTESATTALYQLIGTAPLVQNGAANALKFFANYTYNNVSVPALSVVTPVATTDYLFNTSSDGSGTDKTADCTLIIYNFGDSAQVVATNLSGVSVYLTKCNIRGVAVYEVNASDVTYPADATTVAQPKEFTVDLPWQQDINTAVDIVQTVGAFLDALHPLPIIQIEERPSLQFTPDLFSIVTAQIPKLGIDSSSFRVGHIHHESLVDTCQALRTRIVLEPYIAAGDYWTFPILDYGTDTVFGY